MRVFDPVPPKIEGVAKLIVNCAGRVHKELGPGLLPEIYTTCLLHELNSHGLGIQRDVPVPLVYDGVVLEEKFKLDLLVEGHVIVQIKAAPFQPLDEAELLTYLRLAGKRLGLLVNFNVTAIKQGIKRVVI